MLMTYGTGLIANAPIDQARAETMVQDVVTVPPPRGLGFVLPHPGVLASAVPLVVRLHQRWVCPAPALGKAEPVPRFLLAIVSMTTSPWFTPVTLTDGVTLLPVAEKNAPRGVV